MNAEQLEKWIEEVTFGADDVRRDCVAVDKICALFEGKVLVPVEPTAEMKTAGISVEVYPDSKPDIECLTWREVDAIYRAMLAASQEQGQ